MISYVTYDSDGNLTGAYLQDLQDDQAGAFILASDSERANWTAYRANAARDGLELIPATLPPPGLTKDDGEVAIQAALDDLARAWGYDDIKSAATYVGDPFARFDAEGTALRNWRSATWAASADLDAAVMAGNATAPATVAALLALMPPAPVRP